MSSIDTPVPQKSINCTSNNNNRNLPFFVADSQEFYCCLEQIATPTKRLLRKIQRLRKKSRAITWRPSLARLIETPPSQLRRHNSILRCPP